MWILEVIKNFYAHPKRLASKWKVKELYSAVIYIGLTIWQSSKDSIKPSLLWPLKTLKHNSSNLKHQSLLDEQHNRTISSHPLYLPGDLGNIGLTSEGIQYMPDMTTFRKTTLVVYWGFHRWCVHSTGEQEPKGSVVFCWDGNMFPCQQVRPTGKWEECGRKMSRENREMRALWKDGIQAEEKELEEKEDRVRGKTLAQNISEDRRACRLEGYSHVHIQDFSSLHRDRKHHS